MGYLLSIMPFDIEITLKAQNIIFLQSQDFLYTMVFMRVSEARLTCQMDNLGLNLYPQMDNLTRINYSVSP